MTCGRIVFLVLVFASNAAAQTPAPAAPPATDPPPLRIGPVTLTGYLQADALTVAGDDLEEQNDTFRIRRMRVGLSGDLAPKVGWVFSLEAAGSPHVRDAHITLRFVDWANVRFGQFYQPFSLDRLTSTSRLEIIDRAPVTERVALTRDPGVMVFNARPLLGWLSYFLNVSNGTGMNVSDNNDAKDVTGRIVITHPVLRGFSVGINGSSGEQPTGTRNRGGVDVSIDTRIFKFVVEGLVEESDNTGPDRDGFYVLGVYRIHPAQVTPHFRMVEFAARYASLDDSSGARPATPIRSFIPDTTNEFQFGANYHVNRNVKFMANAILPMDDRDVPSAALIGRLQIIF
jgi:phosphate-selective porin